MDIPAYGKFLSPQLLERLLAQARPCAAVEGLRLSPHATGESEGFLRFLDALYEKTKVELAALLRQRELDRKFIDERTRALYQHQLRADFSSVDYQTVLGLEDADGRIVVGPKGPHAFAGVGEKIAELPAHLQGPHVTLFGPPDSAKLAVNAMNAYHRKLPGEPAVVERLLSHSTLVPKWGADDEDSKTPMHQDLWAAHQNLSGCLDGSLEFTDEKSGKRYALMAEKRAVPLKRFPGLALPCAFIFKHGSPLPLHLYDFALHFYQHAAHPERLSYYVPKLENEEEARYLKNMLRCAEDLIAPGVPGYVKGSIRLMIVLENPRAIFRTHEIMDELYPYFAGASLGWHDFLASTARLFKEDGHYRIPVKADPNIVIKYIKASHRLLAQTVGSRGGVKIGGMYGVLPLGSDLQGDSFQVTLAGYFKDVITQFRRGLSGFWVAHPDFVRLGLALVEAWTLKEQGNESALVELIDGLLKPQYAREVRQFLESEDIAGLDFADPGFARQLIVADLKESDFIANNHPDEIRYNVFQCLQYLADWLAGNGCVALPASIAGTPVRVMDDLATTERSRWEVWHELHHGRFKLEDFVRIACEELRFIRKDLSDEKKIVQVKYNEWYPVALRLMLKLMTDPHPVEFATELLLPFTTDGIRNAADPWQEALRLVPQLELSPEVGRLLAGFEALSHSSFARAFAQQIVFDEGALKQVVAGFTPEDVNYAAAFHGDIGERPVTLDAHAKSEQAQVSRSAEELRRQLLRLGDDYRHKFGMKFLIAAKGKSPEFLLTELQRRLESEPADELQAAREALLSIALMRLTPMLKRGEWQQKLGAVKGAQFALSRKGVIQTLGLGTRDGKNPVTEKTSFEIASLSKTIAAAFSLEFFRARGIALESSVNELLASTASAFRLKGPWGDAVTLEHLISHRALNLHYVNGVPADLPMPPIARFLDGNSDYGYAPVEVIHPPGEKFSYSGGGFLVLEHLLEALAGQSIPELTRAFLDALEMRETHFELRGAELASGFRESGEALASKVWRYPAFAAGAFAPASDMMRFLVTLAQAYHDPKAQAPISHETAVRMLYGRDLGCREFMGCDMGLGVFILEGGENRWMVHQGANDGFRCLYLYCFKGPDFGKGLVALVNGELSGVKLIAALTQEWLAAEKVSGIEFAKFKAAFDAQGLKQEEVVNIGYRDLIFNAFSPRLPEVIQRPARRLRDADHNKAVGARILRVTNQLFARAENLFSPEAPYFDPELFGREGKIMDSWETVRHNPSFDELEFELRAPSAIRFVSFSTMYHLGNQAPEVELLALGASGDWRSLLRSRLEGHSLLKLALPPAAEKFQRLRVRIYPDGGLTRLGIFDETLPRELQQDFAPVERARSQRFSEAIPQTKKPLSLPFTTPTHVSVPKDTLIDLASRAWGGEVEEASNQHYGPASQVNSPYPPLNMFDGLESARSRLAGSFEYVTLKFGAAGVVQEVQLDFTYFVNNNPRDVVLELETKSGWQEVYRGFSKPFAGNLMNVAVDQVLATRVRLKCYPCGGVNRIRVFGKRA